MSVENIVNKFKYTDLTGDQIYQSIGKYPVPYSDLSKYSSIEDLCPPQSPFQVLLLQVSNQNSGHYVAIWINYKANYIYYFDSYGYGVDQAITLGLVMYDKMHYPLYLSQLLQRSNKKVMFNKVDYQSKRDTRTATCGRYSTFAVNNRALFPDNFNRIFKNNKSPYLSNPDNLITILTLQNFDDFDLYYN